jgi:hypothetical protein
MDWPGHSLAMPACLASVMDVPGQVPICKLLASFRTLLILLP